MPLSNMTGGYTFSGMSDMSSFVADTVTIAPELLFLIFFAVGLSFLIGLAFSFKFMKAIKEFLEKLTYSVRYTVIGLTSVIVSYCLYIGFMWIYSETENLNIPPQYFLYGLLIYIGVTYLGYAISGLVEYMIRNYEKLKDEK